MMPEQFTQREKALIPRLTDEFLSTLLEAVRVDGWSSDYVETSQFVGNLFNLAQKEIPSDLSTPYKDSDDDTRTSS